MVVRWVRLGWIYTLVGRVGLRWVGLGEEKLALKLMLFIVMSCVLPAPPAFVLVKAGRGMNVQICTKASNLVHRYILTCWTQICRQPKPIFNGVAILDDSKWPPSKNTFLHFWPTNSHRITNKTTFRGFSTPRNPIVISE